MQQLGDISQLLCCLCKTSPSCSKLYLYKCWEQQSQYKYATTIVLCAAHLVRFWALCMESLPAGNKRRFTATQLTLV